MNSTAYSISGKYYSERGYFYQRKNNDTWSRLELYLPAATGTYKEPLQYTMIRFLSDLESGKRIAKRAINGDGSFNTKTYKRNAKGFLVVR